MVAVLPTRVYVAAAVLDDPVRHGDVEELLECVGAHAKQQLKAAVGVNVVAAWHLELDVEVEPHGRVGSDKFEKVSVGLIDPVVHCLKVGDRGVGRVAAAARGVVVDHAKAMAVGFGVIEHGVLGPVFRKIVHSIELWASSDARAAARYTHGGHGEP